MASTLAHTHDIAAGHEETIWFLGGLLIVKAAGDATNGAFDLIEQYWPAGFAPPPHVHEREEESFYVLEGTVTFRIGDTTFRAGPGEVVVLPRGVLHTFKVDEAAPARLLALYTPSGAKAFFAEFGEPARTPSLPPPTAPDIPRLLAVASKYGIVILGPAASKGAANK